MNQKEIGEFVTKIIKERNMSTYAVEKGAGIQVKVLKVIQNGENWTAKSLFRLLDFLNLEIEIKEKEVATDTWRKEFIKNSDMKVT